MRVLITGAGGQLGRDLVAAFAPDDVTGLTHEQLDVTDEAAVVAAVRDHVPDLVVHAAAQTDVEACEAKADDAWHVNAVGTWWVARACALGCAALVYLSTADVFDGAAGRPYTEYDRPNPRSTYGRSKEAGEQHVRQALAQHYIVRTGWLHGVHGGGFAKAVLRRAREHGVVPVADDQTGSPTFTSDLAPAIRALAATARHGTYHLTNQGHATWLEFARALLDAAGVDAAVEPSGTSGAPRPAFSVLDNRLARLTGLAPLPHWRDSLGRFARDLEKPSPAGTSPP